METTIILSKRNCHRAATVRNINNPEWGTWKFNYKGQELSNGRYAHTVGVGCNSKVLHVEEMKGWEVTTWKYAINLEEYYSLAYSAFNWTSFDPDRRAERTIIDYEKELNNDLLNMPEEEKERYINNYKKYFSAWLSAHSNCASSAITGGSGFNVRKAEKANNREHARMQDFINWREKALKAIARRIEDNKPEEQKQNEDWQCLERSILRSATIIHGINTGVERGCHKALFVSSIFNKVETFAKHGDVEIVEKAIDCIRHFNETKSVVITERHKFFKLVEVAEAVKAKTTDKANRENGELTFKGGTMVYNYQDDRVQLFFDEKPGEELREQLKRKYGFKWAPSNKAWQRQLTNNAIHAANSFLQNNNFLPE